MDSKEIKSVLKSVKENLDQKDFKSAIKQCKTILKADRNNYLALVFYGVAVQETEQKDEAPKAFKKAIEVSPEQILAWRGLGSYYERNENEAAELLNVYGKLLVLETDNTKLPDLIKKYEKVAVSQSDNSSLKMIFSSLSSFDNDKKILMQQCLVNVISSKGHVPQDLILDYQILLEDLISNESLKNHLDLIKKYLKVLYKQQNLKKLLVEASKVLETNTDDVSVLEWICKAYTELSDEVLKDLEDYSPKEAYSRLIQVDPKSYLGFFCKGIHELNCGDILNALESFKEAVTFKSNSSVMWFKLCSVQVLLYHFPEAEESSLKALNLLEPNEKNFLSCKVLLLQSLCEQDDEQKLAEAVVLGEKLVEINSDDKEVLQYLIKAQIKLKKFSEAENNLKKLGESEKHITHAKYLDCLKLKFMDKIEECKTNLEKLVTEASDYFMPWLELGKIYYYENNCNSCLTYLLKSTKLNQWCYWNFLFLGHCYRTMLKDLEKARRCYQKAFQLYSGNAEVGISLSNVYRILGKEELNGQLLSAVTSLNPRSKWAWLKLGLHHLSVNQDQEAVNSLRVAVRLDPNDKNAWEYLGDAYFASGAHTSALKSYQRVLELESNSIYPSLQIANIKHLIGLFSESVEEFRIINHQVPDYIPALKGHSEACLSLMKQYLSKNLNGLAHDACQEAVTSLIKCLEQRKDLICIWKLLGDSCALLSSLSEKYCKLKVASWLSVNVNVQDKELTLDKSQVLKLGSRSYCQAIALDSESSSLWYDLAFIYNCMVQVSKTEESRKQVRELACSSIKKSILLNANSWESWTLYGIILASKEIQNYRLAQHCFIKAILIDDTNAVAWTNLGVLYLHLDDLPIANQSFAEAQRYDHDYVMCWVGQAMIAQRTGHYDAMDLFRHSTQLGFSSEGCLGYSNLVCLTLLNTKNKKEKNYLYSIENMNAITVASDVLTWFTDRDPTNCWAFNMLGLLLERGKLYKGSAEAFGQALKIVRTAKVAEGKEEEHSDVTDKILLNYSRVLSNLKRYEEAIDHLKQIKKATFTNQSEMAAAYFRAKLYEEAYSSYETTLEWLATDTELKSHILVAMAAVVYLHQGQEDAKILLMQSCQLKPPSVQGLFALCALGMLHSNLPLSELALTELNQFKDDVRYLGDIAVFQAYIYLFKGQKAKAMRALSEVIHRHPNQPSLWLSLSLLLLHLYPSFDSRSAARCAETALVAGRSTIDVSKVMSLVSLSNLLSGEGLRSLKSSQKAVHMFPDVTENWVVLLASVLSKCLLRESPEEIIWLKKMITYIRRKFESSKPMTQWLSNNNRKIAMLGCRNERSDHLRSHAGSSNRT